MGTVETGSGKTLADANVEGERTEAVKSVQTEVTSASDAGKINSLGGLRDVEMKDVERNVVVEDGGGSEGGNPAGSVFGLAGNENGGRDGDGGVDAVEKGWEGGNGTKGGNGDGEGADVVQESDVRESRSVGQNGGEIEEMSEDLGVDGEGDFGNEGCKFKVGDFVWCKIKNHPWWPGVVYNEKDASELAVKKKSSNRLLVGYFGDGTFSWCHLSQLKPFVENLQELSMTSQSKNFSNALHNTLDVLGRLVEWEFDQCLPEEKRKGLDRPSANNTGVKEGVLVPDGGIHRLLFLQWEPSRLVADLKSLAAHSSASNMLELTVMKSCLSAFYYVKGRYQLWSYIAPQPIIGLEDPSGARDANGWHSSSYQSAMNKLAETSDDKSTQQRKQKSIADILRDDTDVQEGKISSRKRKARVVSDVQNGIGSSSKTKSRKTVQSKASNVDGDVAVGEEGQDVDQTAQDMDDGSISGKKTMIRVLNVQSEDSEVNEQSARSSREKKKSKYLSPPYTSPSPMKKNESLEAESIHISSEARVSEKMTKATGNLTDGSPALKNDNKAGQRKHAEENAKQSSRYPTTPKRTETMINPMNLQLSANEVLAGIVSAACSPTCTGDNKTLGDVKDYLHAFRKSVFSDESNAKGQKSGDGQKRKAPDAEINGGTKSVQTGKKPQKPKDGKASLPYSGVLKDKLDLISSMVEVLGSENVSELKPKLQAEIGAVKEWILD